MIVRRFIKKYALKYVKNNENEPINGMLLVWSQIEIAKLRRYGRTPVKS